MQIFVDRLQERARELGMSQADVARHAGLNERRFNHYACGRRQPDLSTLVRIAEALKTTPNWLLGVEPFGSGDQRQLIEARLLAACATFNLDQLRLAMHLVTALSKFQPHDMETRPDRGGSRKSDRARERRRTP